MVESRQGLTPEQRCGLVEMIAVWKEVISRSIVFKSIDDQGRPQIQVSVVLPYDEEFPLGRLFKLLPKLRQVVKLLRLVLVLDASLIYDINEEMWDNKRHKANEAFLKRNQKPCRLEVLFSSRQIQSKTLEWFFLYFLRMPFSWEGDFSLFAMVQDALMTRIERVHGIAPCATALPAVCFRFDLDYLDHKVPDLTAHEDTSFQRMTRFALALRESDIYGTSIIKARVCWLSQDEPITPMLVEQVHDMVAAGILIKSKCITLDPTRIMCSKDQLGRFLQEIGSPLANVTIHDLASTLGLARRDFFAAVSVNRRIHVSIKPTSATNQQNDDWWPLLLDLFDLLLSRPFGIGILKMEYDGMMRFDANMDALAAAWKASNPIKRLRVVHIEMRGNVAKLANAMVLALDDVADVVLDVVSPAPLAPSKLITLATGKFRNLEFLDVAGSKIQLMDLFSENLLPLLWELRLRNVELQDPSSLHRFFGSLNVSAGMRARKLVGLHLFGKGLDVDEELAHVLSMVLTTNRVLCRIECRPCGDPTEVEEIKETLSKHNGDAVFESRCEHLSWQAKRQRRALLSVVTHAKDGSARSRVDPSVVQIIFDYSAPHRKRYIWFRA